MVLSLQIFFCAFAVAISVITADVRFDSKEVNGFKMIQRNVPANLGADGNPIREGDQQNILRYRVPSTFGYKKLEKQKRRNNDQFLRSNIDNQANQRNTRTEPALDMTPCRQPDSTTQKPMKWRRGETVQLPVRWNNPHDSSCEVNIWANKMTKVAPIKRPFKCGGGYQDQRFTIRIPLDLPECDKEGCVLQFYGHSVEPRTYAACINFELVGGTNSYQGANASVTATGDAFDLKQAVFTKPIYYWDSYDTSHVDSQYSGYRGQQEKYVRDEVKAAIELRSYCGNGGLIKTISKREVKQRKRMAKKVKRAIKAAERVAIRRNRIMQMRLSRNSPRGRWQCFEGKEYGVVNNRWCRRLYTNTYVTNVGYRQIMEKFAPLFQRAGLKPYTPKLKNSMATPVDPIGQYKGRKGRPSQVPKGGRRIPKAPVMPLTDDDRDTGDRIKPDGNNPKNYRKNSNNEIKVGDNPDDKPDVSEYDQY